jgi:hypothetical protein
MYHKVQEVPLEMIEKARRKRQDQGMTVGDRLFKEVMSEEEEDENGYFDKKIKAFTLCMISNPAQCGYDQTMQVWKTSRSNTNDTKKIVVSSSAYLNA